MELELGRLSLFQQEVREEEEAYKLHEAQKAVMRLQQHKKSSQNMQLKRQQLMKSGQKLSFFFLICFLPIAFVYLDCVFSCECVLGGHILNLN